MRALVQRVNQASVTVDEQVLGAVDAGLVVLAGVCEADNKATADLLAEKIVKLRLFEGDGGQFDRSVLDVGGGVLVVSQFTLYADVRKGRRPSFTDAARPAHAEPLCDYLARRFEALGVSHVATGQFGAHMAVSLVNDGPVTLWLDTAEW
jgi:D-tyrosyl-tRNA(Tyr) deacylase